MLLLELGDEPRDIECPVDGAIWPQTARRLLELPLTADPIAALGLVPGHCYVHEPLEEVTFRLVRLPPDVFQDLMRGEVLALVDQGEAAFVITRRL